MSASVDIFLSQCICANKKNKGPHRYSDLKHITASHPLHILALDLYFYADEIYLTVFCIYSRFCWAKHIANKQASTVLAAYIEFCDTYAKPMLLSCDNGGEFSLIEDIKIPHPSEHPQANGIIERFHEELGKMCRIHSSTPDKIFHLLNSSKSTLLLHSYVKCCIMILPTAFCTMGQENFHIMIWFGEKYLHVREPRMRTLSQVHTEYLNAQESSPIK